MGQFWLLHERSLQKAYTSPVYLVRGERWYGNQFYKTLQVWYGDIRATMRINIMMTYCSSSAWRWVSPFPSSAAGPQGLGRPCQGYWTKAQSAQAQREAWPPGQWFAGFQTVKCSCFNRCKWHQVSGWWGWGQTKLGFSNFGPWILYKKK